MQLNNYLNLAAIVLLSNCPNCPLLELFPRKPSTLKLLLRGFFFNSPTYCIALQCIRVYRA